MKGFTVWKPGVALAVAAQFTALPGHCQPQRPPAVELHFTHTRRSCEVKMCAGPEMLQLARVTPDVGTSRAGDPHSPIQGSPKAGSPESSWDRNILF